MISQTKFHFFQRRGLLALCLAMVCLFTACGKQDVATADNEAEANLMFDILYSRSFNVIKERLEGDKETWQISIDEGWFGDGEAAAAIQILRDHGLPRAPETETKGSDSIGIVSDREEKDKQKRQLQIQIEKLLYSLPDVIQAGVIIALPTDDVFALEKTPTTASVSLVLKQYPPKFKAEDVKNLVSGSVPNLTPDNVRVAFSQQNMREVPLEKLAAQRRSNAIFAVGIGVVLLLALALGAVLFISKRRKDTLDDDELKELTEGEDYNEMENAETPLLDSNFEE